MGPTGAACIMIFNPGAAQTVKVDLSSLPPDRYGHTPIDLFTNTSGPPLAADWSVDPARCAPTDLLARHAPRAGKKDDCVADDGYRRPANATTLQGAFLECLKEPKCDNVYIEYAKIGWRSDASRTPALTRPLPPSPLRAFPTQVDGGGAAAEDDAARQGRRPGRRVQAGDGHPRQETRRRPAGGGGRRAARGRDPRLRVGEFHVREVPARRPGGRRGPFGWAWWSRRSTSTSVAVAPPHVKWSADAPVAPWMPYAKLTEVEKCRT